MIAVYSPTFPRPDYVVRAAVAAEDERRANRLESASRNRRDAQFKPRLRLFSVSRATSTVPNSRNWGAYSRTTGMSLRKRAVLAARSKSPKRNCTSFPICCTICKSKHKSQAHVSIDFFQLHSPTRYVLFGLAPSSWGSWHAQSWARGDC